MRHINPSGSSGSILELGMQLSQISLFYSQLTEGTNIFHQIIILICLYIYIYIHIMAVGWERERKRKMSVIHVLKVNHNPSLTCCRHPFFFKSPNIPNPSPHYFQSATRFPLSPTPPFLFMEEKLKNGVNSIIFGNKQIGRSKVICARQILIETECHKDAKCLNVSSAVISWEPQTWVIKHKTYRNPSRPSSLLCNIDAIFMHIWNLYSNFFKKFFFSIKKCAFKKK